MSYKSGIFPLMLFIYPQFSWRYTCDVMKRRVLIGSRMRGHQGGFDRKLTQKRDTMNLVTTRTSWFWKHSKLILFSILWLVFTSCFFVLIYPTSLVSSIVDVKMVSTRKKTQQNKGLFSQLSESDNDSMIGQSNQIEQIESIDNMICRGTSSDIISNATHVNYPQVMCTYLRKILLVKYEVKWMMWWHESNLESKTQYWLE